MQKRNILFIMESLDLGGAEKSLIDILKNFDFNIYSVTLCLIHNKGVLLSQLPVEIELLYLYPKRNNKFVYILQRIPIKLFKHFNIIFPLRRIITNKIRNRHFDIGISYLEGISLVFHDFITNKCNLNISWVHCDLEQYHWTMKLIYNKEYERICYSHMDKIVFVSASIKNSFERIHDVNVEKVILHNNINVQEINELASKENIIKNQFTITSIGTLKEIKGFDRLLRVAKVLKNDGFIFKVQIIGDGIDRLVLEKISTDLELENIVYFMGPKLNPYPYLKLSDIFVSTSISEGFSLVICEALALQVPVVATKTAGAMEILENNIYGLLTEHDDIAIYNAIKSLMQNDNLRKYYSQSSLTKIKSFNLESSMKNIYNLFE